MDATPTAQAGNQAKMDALAQLFASKAPQAGPGGAVAGPAEMMPGQAKDTAADSSAPGAPGAPNAMPAGGEDGLLGALRNLFKFFQAKPASASNDNKYQNSMTEAGIPSGETGVGM